MSTTTEAKQEILIVARSPEHRANLRVLLESENYDVREANCEELALELLSPALALIILYIVSQDSPGYRLCRTIREFSNTPILFLSSKEDHSDLLMCYASGGDDYLPCPFSYAELMARVKALIRRYLIYRGRRSTPVEQACLEHSGLRLDCSRNQVWKDGKSLNLTDKEYQILKFLMSRHGQPFSTQEIYEAVWGEAYLPSTANNVVVFIRRLRGKIEDDPKNPRILLTVWGKGYKVV